MTPSLRRLFDPISRYTHWLHTRWPAGTVERLPEAREDGTTAIPGVRIVGDLTGIPLLKFSADTGAKAVHAILQESDFAGRRGQDNTLDLAIIGGGVSGIAAAMEAKKAGLHFAVFEATQIFSTIVNFPKAKPIYTYPRAMTPAGELQFRADVKEALVEELEAQRKAAGIDVIPARIERIERGNGTLLLHQANHQPPLPPLRALRVIVAIGRSGNFRMLDVPGEQLDKVYNRLYDPKDHAGQDALVVGGGDSALETAIALATCGARVTLSYRKNEFARPKAENVEKLEMLMRDPAARVEIEHPVSERVNSAAGDYMKDGAPAGLTKNGSIHLALGTQVKEIREGDVVLTDAAGKKQTLANDVVFTMIGREPPLDFFRRSGMPIRGEWRLAGILSMALFLAFCFWMYHWKKSGIFPDIGGWWNGHHWFPANVAGLFASGTLRDLAERRGNILHPLKVSLGEAGFYYSLAYCLIVVIFGIRRIRRRKTAYVRLQTWTLAAIQVIPLFLLPYIILPWLGGNGFFDTGIRKWLADQLFPIVTYGHGREYWRAFGLILAWPLFIFNVFTDKPMWLWLGISFVQTFVIIPAIIYFWGKGAYCGWICSCGALAETLGDSHRQKMPHGPGWNRLNMAGQAILALALVLLGLRILDWSGAGWAHRAFALISHDIPLLNYSWFVDLFLSGIIGVGLYFWFSGRIWCRFFCPLAALMHIYARFSRFRIFADKKKCISCNVCTSVCHQGIDVMNFANKGVPMEDPQCVRCSACVQQCPTGVLSFGRLTHNGKVIEPLLAASPVRMREG